MNHRGKNPIREDLETLRDCTARDLPSREETARAVRTRLARAPREGSIMKLTRSAGARPALATAIGVVAVAVALLVIPISYVRTVGYQVTLSLPSVDPVQVRSIAAEFAKLLGTRAGNVSVDTAAGTAISARVPVRSRRVVEGLAMAYTQALAMRGIGARARVAPVTERTSGNVYAAAASRLYEFRVSRDGKTNDQIAAELQAQFEAAGLHGAVVRVTGDGNETRLEMQWQAAPGDTTGGEKEFQITVEGQGEAKTAP